MQLPSSSLGAVISIHPASAMQGLQQMMPDVRTTIGRAREIANEGTIWRPKFEFDLNPSPARLREYIYSAPPSHPVAIDIEGWNRIDLIGVSVSPWSALVSSGEPEYLDVVAEVLGDPSLLKLGHNFTYDLREFLKAGADFREPIADTIQMEAVLRPPFKEAKKRRWLSLSTCVLRRLPLPYWKEEKNPQTRALYSKWFPGVPGWRYDRLYCALDASLTWMLFQKQKAELEESGRKKLYFDIVAPANAALVRMEDYGVPVNVELLNRRRKETSEEIARIDKKIEVETTDRHQLRKTAVQGGISRLEVERSAIKDRRSPDRKALTKRIAALRTKQKQIGETFDSGNENHWRWLLFSAPEDGGLGLRATELTGKAGLGAVDKEAIEELQKIYPKVEILAMKVELSHLYRRQRWMNGRKQKDGTIKGGLYPDKYGRVHVPWSLHRTENGRVASGFDDAEADKTRESDGGNLMNVPKKDRAIFCAEPGMVWVAGDMSQVELRVMAWLARDLQLLGELRDGVDVHSENAAAIFGCGPTRAEAEAFMVNFEGKACSARDASKRPTHGWDYGLGDAKCGRMTHPCEEMGLEEALELIFKEYRASFGAFGMNEASWLRRKKQAEKQNSMPKLIRLIYDEANTITARGWRLRYFARRKGLANFQGRVIEEVEKNRKLTNPYGRILEFHNFRYDYKLNKWNIGDREEALAFLPASSVADEAKAMIGEMYDCAKKHGGRLLIFNHDEFSAQVPEANVAAYLKDARTIMERPWYALGEIEGFGYFRCPAKFEVGPNWGTLHAA